MPFNGSGTFVPPSAPTYPAVDGTTIMASQFNDALQDVYTGLSTCLTKDGQGVPSANLPMNGYKHTGAGAGSASGQYLTYGQTGASLATLSLSATTASLLSTSTSAGQTILGNSTVDGADNRQVILRGGGATATNRGAFLSLDGNEGATPGVAHLSSGDTGVLKLSSPGGPIDVQHAMSAASSVAVAGTLSAATLMTFTDTAAGDSILGNTTSDGSDIRRLTLRSGGATASNRGAFLRLAGNEHASTPGRVELYAGDTGTIVMEGNTALTGTFTASGQITGASYSGVPVNGDTAANALGFRGIPATTAAAWENGRCREVAAGVTLNTADMVTGYAFSVYNNSGAPITITQGAGVTMYLAGTATTGNRTLAQRGYATIRCRTGTEAVIMGQGLS